MAMTSRPTTSQRGYGASHQKLRDKYKPMVDAGQALCWRCGNRILPGQKWHLGHDDIDRRKYRGPEHVSCNCGTRNRPPSRRIAPALAFFR